MSQVSLLKNIPEFLSQPTGIAAIASLGIHGAIALIVPLIPVDSENSKKVETPSSVGILELSQADQNRLPQTPNALPTSPALQPELPLQPSIPLQPGISLQAGLPLQQPSPPPPDIQQRMLSPLAVPTNRQPVVFQSRTQYTPPPPSPSTPPATKPQSNPPLSFDRSFDVANRKFNPQTIAFNANQIKIAPVLTRENKLPQVKPSETPPDSLSNNTANSTNPETTKVPQAADNLKNPIQATSSQRENASKPEPIPNPTKADTDKPPLVARLNTYQNVRAEISQKYPNSQEKPVLRETVANQEAAAEGTIWGFLVVDTDGKVLDIKFSDTDKSATRELQLQARQYFSTKTPKSEGQISTYPFNLSFQNNNSNTAAVPANTSKPLPELKLRVQEPTATNVAAEPASSEQNNNLPSPPMEPDKNLRQLLRQHREAREQSNQ